MVPNDTVPGGRYVVVQRRLTPGVNEAAKLALPLDLQTTLYAKLDALRPQGPPAGEGFRAPGVWSKVEGLGVGV